MKCQKTFKSLPFLMKISTLVCNFNFISNSEVDVTELFLVACKTKMAKYESLSSSFCFRRVFVMVWIALSTNPLLWQNTGVEVLCMNSHDLENFLNSCELYWGPLSLNTTLGMWCHANIHLIWVMTVSDEAFGSWASSKYLLV